MIVVKIGGTGGIDPTPVLRDLAGLDEPWILVHGGNEELSDLQRALGDEPRFITSPSGHVSRFTDEAAVANIQRAYRGRINNDLVLRLQNLGVRAVGLSGVDGGVLRATRKDTVRAVVDGRKMLLRGDHTGTIHTVDTKLLRTLAAGGFRPVLTLPAWADTGEAVNVDGDRAAAMVATAMGAHTLVILSDVPGLLRDVDDADSLIEHIPRQRLAEHQGFAKGRFRKKLMGVQEALDGGVGRIVLATSRGEHPVQEALAGGGTVIA